MIYYILMEEQIKNAIRKATQKLGLPPVDVEIDRPGNPQFGNYSSNVALRIPRGAGESPEALAQKIVEVIEKPTGISKVDVALPGFINFFLSDDYLRDCVARVIKSGTTYGRNDTHKGEKILIEYTDPNPFKELHIGHLMSNAIGESLSRIFEYSGAEVKRANYQGDVGLHVAKAIWGWLSLMREGKMKLEALSNFSLEDRAQALGTFYVRGAMAYEDDASGEVRKEIEELNKKIYEKTDGTVNELYEHGRAWSLEKFEEIYKRLGTKFDFYFFESETGIFGKEVVAEHIEDGIFEESDGAIIFRGEKYGLHTRVFVTAGGLPTYEAKELGLAQIKHKRYPYDISFVVTGNEIVEYFKVLLAAMKLVFLGLAEKTRHIPHGMLRLSGGKMSSRKGEVISAEEIIKEVKKLILSKMGERIVGSERDEVAFQVAVGALKYAMLKQASGRDIIFDFDTSVSFEGSSGPYLQYAFARTCSVLNKAKQEGVLGGAGEGGVSSGIENLLERFPDVVRKAQKEHASHHITNYLLELAQAFNNFYAKEKIVGAEKDSSYKVALTEAVSIVLKNGLWLLGMPAPERM